MTIIGGYETEDAIYIAGDRWVDIHPAGYQTRKVFVECPIGRVAIVGLCGSGALAEPILDCVRAHVRESLVSSPFDLGQRIRQNLRESGWDPGSGENGAPPSWDGGFLYADSDHGLWRFPDSLYPDEMPQHFPVFIGNLCEYAQGAFMALSMPLEGVLKREHPGHAVLLRDACKYASRCSGHPTSIDVVSVSKRKEQDESRGDPESRDLPPSHGGGAGAA